MAYPKLNFYYPLALLKFFPSSIILTFAFCCSQMTQVLHAQEFQFGLKAGYLTSQIDGDNLKGFNKPGYTFGALGGFAINDEQWIVVECTYQTFGSQIKSELRTLRVTSQKNLFIWDFNSASVFLGYSHAQDKKKDRSIRMRALGGLRAHGIVKKEVEIRKTAGTVAAPTINEEDVKSLLLTFTFGAGVFLTDDLILDVVYDYRLNNLLDVQQGDMRDLPDIFPYYYSLNLSFYFGGKAKRKRNAKNRRRRR